MALYKSVPTMQESVILASDELYQSVLLASNLWDTIRLYYNNVTDVYSG